jgi:hypothetical protein
MAITFFLIGKGDRLFLLKREEVIAFLILAEFATAYPELSILTHHRQ